MTDLHERLIAELQDFARSAASVHVLMQQISDRLHQEFARYNWVGFYLLDKKDGSMLELGPFAGSFTPHMRIPVTQGLCGAAALAGHTVVVNDVSKDTRYLPGSTNTKSEIVVPIFAHNAFFGELDINSYFKETFTPQECSFVEQCAEIVAKRA